MGTPFKAAAVAVVQTFLFSTCKDFVAQTIPKFNVITIRRQRVELRRSLQVRT